MLDTAGALQLRDALGLIRGEAKSLTLLLAEMALAHRNTVMVGRTHGVHAEPMVLGHKLAVWAFEMERNLERLAHAEEVASVGKISGAVGVYANVDPKVEALTCEELGHLVVAGLDPGRAAGPARGGALGARHPRLDDGEDSAGDQGRAADGGPGARRAFRPRPEGLLRDAPQEEPHPLPSASAAWPA